MRSQKLRKILGTVGYLCISISFIIGCNNPGQVEIPPLLLTVEGNKSVRINEQAKVHVLIKDAGTRDVRYVWTVDNSRQDTTKEFIRYFTWIFPDTGIHLIVISAIDINGMKAKPESLKVNVTCKFPEIFLNQNDTTIQSRDTIFLDPQVNDADGKVVAIQWKIDNDSLWYSTALVCRLFTWNRLQNGVHTIRVRSVDNDNLVSSVDSVCITVKTIPGNIIILQNDTTIEIHKKISLRTKVTEFKTGAIGYVWIIDKVTNKADTAGTLDISFGLNDTGLHRIKACAFDRDSVFTNMDSVLIRVKCKPSRTTFITNDTKIYSWYPLTIRAKTSDTVGKKHLYSFFIDGKPTKESSEADSLLKIFSVSDSGKHTITVYTVDNDSVRSSIDTINITVLAGYPVLNLMNDTILSSKDSLTIIARANDYNGEIKSYVWKINGVQGTSTDSICKIGYSENSLIEVNASVTDNDNLIVSNTMKITFNTSPKIAIVKSPPDTLYCSELLPSAYAIYKYILFDIENDTLKIKCKVENSRHEILSDTLYGKDSARVALNGPGVYFLTLTCSDSFGNKVLISDTVTVIQRHTICFAGHSIICGMAGDGQNGGSRAKVLAGLREKLLPNHLIKAVGPITTPDMSKYPEDDSCFAISGSIGKEMHNLLRVAYKSLSADICVLMLGANAGYTTVELNNTIAITDSMLLRNRGARVYILTSPPFPGENYDFYWANISLKTFNKGIRDSVALRVSKGYHVSVVEAAPLLSKPDTTFDSTWFADHVHPNNAGYDRLGAEILRVMKLDGNVAIKKELYRVE